MQGRTLMCTARHSPPAAVQARGSHRLLLQSTRALPQGSGSNASFAAPTEPGTSTVIETPGQTEAANPVPSGQWESGGDTGAIYIYATLMKGGEVIGWSVSCAPGRAGWVALQGRRLQNPRLDRAATFQAQHAACVVPQAKVAHVGWAPRPCMSVSR